MGRRTTIKISVLSSINTQVRVLKKSTYFFHSDKVKIGSHYKFTHAVLICEFMNHLLGPMFVLSETQLSEKIRKAQSQGEPSVPCLLRAVLFVF